MHEQAHLKNSFTKNLGGEESAWPGQIRDLRCLSGKTQPLSILPADAMGVSEIVTTDPPEPANTPKWGGPTFYFCNTGKYKQRSRGDEEKLTFDYMVENMKFVRHPNPKLKWMVTTAILFS